MTAHRPLPLGGSHRCETCGLPLVLVTRYPERIDAAGVRHYEARSWWQHAPRPKGVSR